MGTHRVFKALNRRQNMLGLAAFAGALGGAALHIGADMANRTDAPLRAAVAVVLGIGGLAALFLGMRIAREHVVVDRAGILIEARRGARRVLWSEIESIAFVGVDAVEPAHVACVETWLSIRCLDGRAELFAQTMGVRLAGADCAALADIAARATFEPLLRRAIERFAAGQPVEFGGLTVAPDGIRVDGLLLPSIDYADLRLAGQHWEVLRRGAPGAWFSVPAVELRNLAILRPFLEHVRRTRGAVRRAADPAPAAAAR